MRGECLNEHLFVSYLHASEILEDCRSEYSLNRPTPSDLRVSVWCNYGYCCFLTTLMRPVG
ncbi:hypothetical protein [Ensifer sp. R-19]|uniref:hypothetical protein n=1 Tax=Ensifer sp. R-19 TaxID=3404055 RepID=UPI003CF7A360